MDGTLIDSEPLHARSIAFSLKQVGIDVPNTLHDEVVGKSALMIYDLLVSKFGFQMPYDDWFLLKQSYIVEHIAELKPRHNLFQLYLKLRKLGVPQAIVSNSDRMLMQVCLNQVDLIRPGMIMISRNDVKEGKPDPEPYQRAAYLLGHAPSACIAIEDSQTGLDSALRSGMQAIFVPPPGAQNTRHGIEEIYDDQVLSLLSDFLKLDITK